MMRLLAHAPGEQRLAEAVVDLVRAGVEQVFALDIDLRAAQVFGEPAREVERRGTARVVRQQNVEFGVERRVLLRLVVSVLEFFERRHQNFGHVASAVRAEVAAGVGLRRIIEPKSCLDKLFHARVVLRPGDDSMPEATSTRPGFARARWPRGRCRGRGRRPGSAAARSMRARQSTSRLCRAVDQDGFGGVVGHFGPRVGHAESLPDANVRADAGRAFRGRAAARCRDSSCAAICSITSGASFTNTPTFQTCGGISASQGASCAP